MQNRALQLTLALALLLRSSALVSLGQSTYQWTGAAGTGSWSNDDNWIEQGTGVHKADSNGILEFAGSVETTNTNDKFSQLFEIKFNSSSAFTLNYDPTLISGQPDFVTFRAHGQLNAPPIDANIRNDGFGTGTLNFNVSFFEPVNAPVGAGRINATNGDIVLNGSVDVSGAVFGLELTGDSGHSVTFNGAITGKGKSFGLTGNHIALLNATNTFSGGTAVAEGILNATTTGALGVTSAIAVSNGGTLLLSGFGNLNRVNDGAGITLAGATIQKAAGASEGTTSSIGLGALTLSAVGSKLDFTGTPGTLTFASFTPAGFDLLIANYLGVGAPGGADQLIFNQDQATQLTHFDFGFGPGIGVAESDLMNGFFEVYSMTPVPEPATWLAGLLTCGAIAFGGGRKMRGHFDKRSQGTKLK